MKRLCACLFFASLLALAPAPDSRAADYTWTGSAQNPDYNAAANWLDGRIAPANDPATIIYFTDQGAGTLRLNLADPAPVFGRFVFQNTTAPYTIEGNNATLAIDGGITLSTGAVTINSLKLSGGTLQVNGPGQLTLNNIASAAPQNTLAITGNASVQITGSAALAANLDIHSAQVVINGANALPPSGKITVDGGYVGYTQNFAARFSDFLARIQAIDDPNTIVGIDSVAPATKRTVSDTIDLTQLDGAPRDTPYYIGTTSNITLTGPVKPTLLPTGAYDTLYAAALGNGYLNIATQLGTTTSPVNSITIGQPAALQPAQGTVELSGNNTYARGTQVLGGTLQINGASNLGAGPLYLGPGATLNTGASAIIAATNTLSLAEGSAISGAGTFNLPVTIGPGVSLIPGAIGTATTLHLHSGVTLEAGANIYLDLGANATDILCTHDFITINGDTSNPINIYLGSVTNANVPGAYANFNPNASYTWRIFYDPNAGNSLLITGYDPAYFKIDSTAFAQLTNTNGGVFDITKIGDNALGITFTPVPEPSTYALTLLGLALLSLTKFRRRRK